MKQNKLAIVVVMGIFAAIAVWSLVRPSESSSIQRVLAHDKAWNEEIARHATLGDTWWDQSDVVGKIVSGMRAIDLSGCPEDFRDAYIRHISAWGAYERFAQRNGGWRGFLKGFFTGGAGVIVAYSEGSQVQDDINSSWGYVLGVAQKHGVIWQAR